MQVQLWLWRLSCVFLFGILLGLTATFVLWDDVRSSPCEQFKFPIPYTLYEVTLQHCELAWVVVWRLIKFDVLRCMLLYVAFTQGSAFFKYIFTTIYGYAKLNKDPPEPQKQVQEDYDNNKAHFTLRCHFELLKSHSFDEDIIFDPEQISQFLINSIHHPRRTTRNQVGNKNVFVTRKWRFIFQSLPITLEKKG